MYLLDTNIVSGLRKKRPNAALVAWISAVEDHRLRIPAPTVTEIQMGIERTRRSDPAKAGEIQEWLAELRASRQVEPLAAEAAALWGIMLESPLRDGSFRNAVDPKRKPRTNWTLDLMIASIAITRGLTLVTNNTADFLRINAHFPLYGILDPMQPPREGDNEPVAPQLH